MAARKTIIGVSLCALLGAGLLHAKGASSNSDVVAKVQQPTTQTITIYVEEGKADHKKMSAEYSTSIKCANDVEYKLTVQSCVIETLTSDATIGVKTELYLNYHLVTQKAFDGLEEYSLKYRMESGELLTVEVDPTHWEKCITFTIRFA